MIVMKKQYNKHKITSDDTQKVDIVKKENIDELLNNSDEISKELKDSDLQQVAGGRAFIPKIKNNQSK